MTGIKEVLSFIQAPFKVVITVIFFCSSFIFLPVTIFQYFGLNEFREAYKATISAAWILSFCILLYIVLEKTFKVIKKKMTDRAEDRKVIQLIKNSDAFHKKLLKAMLNSKGRTLMINISEGKHSFLSGAGLIYRASEVGFPGPNGAVVFPYSIQPWVCELIKKNPGILD